MKQPRQKKLLLPLLPFLGAISLFAPCGVTCFVPSPFARVRLPSRKAPPLRMKSLDEFGDEPLPFWTTSSSSSRREFLCCSTSVAAALASILPGDNTAFASTAGVTDSPFDSHSSTTTPSNIPPPIPFSSRREYRHITLSNGLRVLLVRDEGIPRAGTALSIGNAGQFSDPDELPGCGHLMEHLILSSSRRPSSRNDDDGTDFDDWLGEYDGGSNGFTGAGKVCFHFNCPSDVLSEALHRFAMLFDQELVEETCRNEAILRREVRRIDSELNLMNDATRAFYLLKGLANADHPFRRFGAGSLESLERTPRANGVDVSHCLIDFFDRNYVPDQAVLVVVSPDDVGTLETLVAPFADKLSRKKYADEDGNRIAAVRKYSLPYPAPFRKSNFTQTILVKAKEDSLRQGQGQNGDSDILSLAWPLNFEYNRLEWEGKSSQRSTVITAPVVGFILSQILSRQGPESLHAFLMRRKWVLAGLKGIPRITFPVDVTGFQVMKLEIGLTFEGFANRSAVIAAVLASIKAISRIAPSDKPYLLPREQLSQYLTIATLHGYTLAPRPPDAVELAIDAQTFGLDGKSGVGVLGSWPLVPSTDDIAAVEEVRKAVASTLKTMADPTKTIAIITARRQSIANFVGGLVDPSLPPLASSAQWKHEPLTDAKYYVENVANLERLIVVPLLWALGKVEGDELGPPVLNPLVPPKLRPARSVMETRSADDIAPTTMMLGDRWKVYQAAPGQTDGAVLPMPMISPEPSCRCSFVLQLLSPKPKDASVRQAARAQLWLLSFDDDIVDLAELGAPAGLAYDLSFNRHGLRICFRGVSQTLPSYARRFCRRLVQHHARLVDGSVSIASTTKASAFQQASRLQGMPPLRKQQIISNIRACSSLDAAAEGLAFLNSCDGGLALAQGDILPKEAVTLTKELKSIFSKVSTETYSAPVQPDVEEVLYRPFWKPKTSSPLLIPGVYLIADACGRVQR